VFQGKIKIFTDHNAYISNFTLIFNRKAMQDLKISFIQTELFWEQADKNMDHFDRLIDTIREPVDLILLPEMFNTGFSINPGLCSETMEGRSVQFLRRKASEKNAVVMATILIRERAVFYNRLIAMFPDGRYETYDKRHLFRLSEEFRIFNEGDKKCILQINGWNILPLICYDLRFPVWSKNTWRDGKYEYDLLVFLANWPTIRAHVWKTLLMARAMENQACVVGVNRIGLDGHEIRHSGDSMVVDGKGTVLFATEPGTENVHTQNLSGRDLELFRESFTMGMDWDKFSIDIKI